MADNINENGLPPNNIGDQAISNPAVLDGEHQISGNIQNVSNPAVLDSEYQELASKTRIGNIGVSVGDDAGRNVIMFL